MSKKWLYLKDGGYSNRDFLYGDVKDFTQELDGVENETNLRYRCSDIGERLLDAYDFYLNRMP